ncbi:MAG TPA: aminoacyl-tRNA hydrolase [Candidatus Paceibacterota bacterium]
MSYIIAGLGNPGKEYEGTRHNTGREALLSLSKSLSASSSDEEFSFDKKINALVLEIKIGKEKVMLVAPNTFMNKSGTAISKVVKSVKSAEKLIVIYDDFNLPLGTLKISFNRSSGGHNGLESVIKALKTPAFIRIRIGVSPSNAKGIAKAPHGDDKIEKFILGKYKDNEIKELKKVSKKAILAIEMILKEGKDKAMSVFNAS